MKCVSYTRATSCLPEGEVPKDTIGRQNARIQEYARGKGWEISGKYSDRKKDAREEAAFLRMKADGMERKFDCVVVDSIFRCGTSAQEAMELLGQVFYPAGIQFAVAEDGVCSADMGPGEVQAYLEGKRDEYRRRCPVTSIRKHLEGRVYERYGYMRDPETGQLAANPETAPVVGQIYQMAADGRSCVEIAGALNASGTPVPSVYMGWGNKGTRKLMGGGKWGKENVRAILKCEAYTGKYERLISGEKVDVGCPAIVDAGLFRKAREAASRREPTWMARKTTAGPNPFSARIMDKDTGAWLRTYINPGTGERTFRFGDIRPADAHYEKTGITCAAVMAEAVSAIHREKARALHVLEKIRSQEGEDARQERRAPYVAKMRSLFHEMAEAEGRNVPAWQEWKDGKATEEEYREKQKEITDTILKLDREFGRLMGKVDEIDILFSGQNPWIKLYAGAEAPDELSLAQVRKWIDRVEVRQFEAVEVVLKEQEARRQLPEEWLNGEAE